ncbi:MBL fold metallo-hydrolase [Alkalibacillus silvisoli]|uniref:MBL fold metallo-hydrolase n=1 Tax=Alkalibacillus silvisoli TaxID=392823 RepID=A0ABP3JLX3_9BACI
MNYYIFSLGLLGTNCYVIEKEGRALVVDPGGDTDQLIEYFQEHDIIPEAILLTHAHFDHIGGVEELRTYYKIDVYMHELEREWLTNPDLNGSSRFQVGRISSNNEAEHFLEEGHYNIGGFDFEVLHTPGHSPGSLSFWFESDQKLIAGDTLFQMGIGRTDLPFGDHETLINAIRQKVLVLPDDTEVLPGHGPLTKVSTEKVKNPFL